MVKNILIIRIRGSGGGDSGGGSSPGSSSTNDVYGGLTNTVVDSNNRLGNLIVESNSKLQNSIDSQTESIKENTENNKNFFDKLLGWINPLSDDFFGYALIRMLSDVLKELFVPDAKFMQAWITNMQEFLQDRLGFLTYPVSLSVDILNRFSNLNSSNTAIIVTPELKLMDTVILYSYQFDFYSLLENETLKKLHNIYFLFIDVIIVICLIRFINKVTATIFNENITDDVVEDTHKVYTDYKRESKKRPIGFRKDD